MKGAAIIPESTNSTAEGASLNLGAPYGVPREYSRIPAVLSPNGTLTTFHRLDDGTYGDRVTDASATHVLVHSLTVLRLSHEKESAATKAALCAEVLRWCDHVQRLEYLRHGTEPDASPHILADLARKLATA